MEEARPTFTDRLPNGYRACMRSGLCCKKSACAFGTYDPSAGRCVHLLEIETLPNGAVVHGCAIHDTITTQPGAWVNPAFGAGCCMPMFNQDRDAIVAERRRQAEA